MLGRRHGSDQGKRPRSGKEHAYATSCDLDSGGDFDQSHPSRTSVVFTKRIRSAAAIKVATTRTNRYVLQQEHCLCRGTHQTFRLREDRRLFQ